MNKEIVKVKDLELPDDVFKCAACCVETMECCNCEEGWHYEEKK